MTDWWDSDSRHPANTKSAEFFTKTRVAQLVDDQGDTRTFIVRADYRVDGNGVKLESFDYWPFCEDMEESIRDYLRFV